MHDLLQSTTQQLPESAQLSFCIPDHDRTAFARLPETKKRPVRSTTLYRLDAMRFIHFSRNKRSAVAAMAAKWGESRGFRRGTLRRLYYAYVESNGDWRVLVDRARAGRAWVEADPDALPESFVNEWKRRCEKNQRKCAPARRDLIRDWRRWCAGDTSSKIAGYDRPPEPDPDTGIPQGWSARNLYRHAPSPIELEAARIGPVAASTQRLPVLTSRAELAVGEFYLFDDHEFNLKVNYPGQSRAMRPLMFCAMDLFSGCNFDHGIRPTLWDERDGKKDKLKEDEFRWFVIHILLTHGFRTDGRRTTLIVEHGTAAIRPDFQERIERAAQGQIAIERSGRFFSKAGEGMPQILGGMFPGRPRGNFRFKGWLESLFNLVDNDFAALPGQVGKDREHSPEELHGRDLYNNKMLLAQSLLPETAAAALKMPFMSWDEFLKNALDILRAIALRTDHDLEGWRKCGHFTDEWRLSMDAHAPALPSTLAASAWLPRQSLETLPPAELAVVDALLRNNPGLSRSRALSPMEVWDRGRGELKTLPLIALPDLCDPEDAINASVRNGLFTVERQDLGGELLFMAVVNGEQLPAGAKFDLWIDPFNPSAAVVTDAHGCVLGLARAYERASRNDRPGIERLLGQARHWETQALEELRHRHKGTLRERAAMHASNAAILDEDGTSAAGRPNPEDQSALRRRNSELAAIAKRQREQTEQPNKEDEPWPTTY